MNLPGTRLSAWAGCSGNVKNLVRFPASGFRYVAQSPLLRGHQLHSYHRPFDSHAEIARRGASVLCSERPAATCTLFSEFMTMVALSWS